MMPKWLLMETRMGLASLPGCRPQIRLWGSAANREKTIRNTRGLTLKYHDKQRVFCGCVAYFLGLALDML